MIKSQADDRTFTVQEGQSWKWRRVLDTARFGPEDIMKPSTEHLGHVTPADVQLRDSFGFAPMRILQSGFGGESDAAIHLPHHHSQLCAAYTGNHDNDTWEGWFRNQPRTRQRRGAYLSGRA